MTYKLNVLRNNR